MSFLNHFYLFRRGIAKLVSPDGWVDQAMGVGRVGMMEIIKRAWDTWRLDVHGNLPNDLKERGVADPEALPNYHYRDDGMLLWDCIRKYVAEIVEGHYGTTRYYYYFFIYFLAC